MSTYTITVPADSEADARDIAKRRARDDGLQVIDVQDVHEAPSPDVRKWSVTLTVERRVKP